MVTCGTRPSSRVPSRCNDVVASTAADPSAISLLFEDAHFGALPELVLNTDLMAIVPQMYAANLAQRLDIRVWELPRAAAPRYEVRLVWHASTAQDPAHQWIRAQVHRLFGRADTSA